MSKNVGFNFKNSKTMENIFVIDPNFIYRITLYIFRFNFYMCELIKLCICIRDINKKSLLYFALFVFLEISNQLYIGIK